MSIGEMTILDTLNLHVPHTSILPALFKFRVKPLLYTSILTITTMICRTEYEFRRLIHSSISENM